MTNQGSELTTRPRYETPILFLVFNRIETTKQVFESIRLRQPAKLYISADGPRANREDDAEKCERVRAYVTAVDWDCKVETLFHDANLGCAMSISAGLTWFFENEEMGVILEDDCLPNESFFQVSEELLWRYRDAENVWSFSGSNVFGARDENADYFFSLLGGNWGWASWRRAWKNFRLDVRSQFTDQNWKTIARNLQDEKLASALRKLIESALQGEPPTTWDYQWLFLRLLHNAASIVPNSNLVANIGFIENSTHTSDSASPLASLPTQQAPTSLRHPTGFSINRTFDSAHLKLYKVPLFSQLLSRLRRLTHV